METLSQWKIYVGAFFDRFGSEKLNILGSTDPIIQAAIKDCSVRKYIDLDSRNTELQQLLMYIASKGFNIDANAILNLAPSQDEIWNGEDVQFELPQNVSLMDKAGVVYKVPYGYFTCSIDADTPPADATSRLEVNLLSHQLIAAGAEIVEKDGELFLYKKVE